MLLHGATAVQQILVIARCFVKFIIEQKGINDVKEEGAIKASLPDYFTYDVTYLEEENDFGFNL